MVTLSVTVQELDKQLHNLLAEAQNGAKIVISSSGKPLAQLVPPDSDKKKIQFGVLRGKAKVAEDFDAPLPDEILAEFEGRECVS
ncbi:type II toxin-antitoxin system Phd/YefM family antitoxin [Desulfonatronum thioautotrophicum]|uniref:type II toxin-antitoxin system Phd/YefM family antitoxin n=1 Tax=Desulfonatronum thioautotrophicum TaxID=617001 RepID=UPI0005EBCCDB|nr:type II toxin-antitoxin system prevent-host-death family antitoxin [Desulfonatronum thioautotrophicum]